MVMKMYIGKMFVAKSEIEFRDMETIEERINHGKMIAEHMYWSNYKIIKEMMTQPTFFIDQVPSKMNFRQRET